jgi:hypothetical protein
MCSKPTDVPVGYVACNFVAEEQAKQETSMKLCYHRTKRHYATESRIIFKITKIQTQNVTEEIAYHVINKTPWPESARELHRPSDRRLSVKLVPTTLDRGSRVVSVTDPYGRILGFIDRSRYFFFQVYPQL